MKNLLILLFLGSVLGGCSLLNVSIETEVVPLSERQMNLRNGTHSYAMAMNQFVVSTADSLIAINEDVEVQNEAILWKIGFTGSISKSAFVSDPDLSFMDTWAFTKQHKDFFTSGTGAQLFPTGHELVDYATDSMLTAIENMGMQFYAKKDFELRKSFVDEYAGSEQLKGLDFKRNFILFRWKTFNNIPDNAIVSTVGTLPQVMSEF